LAGVSLALVQDDEGDSVVKLLSDLLDVDSLPTKRRSRVGTEFDYDRSHGVRCTERELCSFKSLQCEVGRDLTRHGLGLGEFIEPSILSRKTRRNH
jgi:hypothetical protein